LVGAAFFFAIFNLLYLGGGVSPSFKSRGKIAQRDARVEQREPLFFQGKNARGPIVTEVVNRCRTRA
jgi:hypothetical protein